MAAGTRAGISTRSGWLLKDKGTHLALQEGDGGRRAANPRAPSSRSRRSTAQPRAAAPVAGRPAAETARLALSALTLAGNSTGGAPRGLGGGGGVLPRVQWGGVAGVVGVHVAPGPGTDPEWRCDHCVAAHWVARKGPHMCGKRNDPLCKGPKAPPPL